jgi:4,5-DOPA dioxygenase extradiol
MKTHPAPSLFVSHGSPTFALETPASSLAAAYLEALAHKTPQPKGILIVSPHWQTRGTQVAIALANQPSTVHDFGGFPSALYALQYPAKGAQWLADAIAAQLAANHVAHGFAPDQGMDHGAWVPLMKLYPQAQIPVVQISLPAQQSPPFYYALGQALAGLREHGVMVIGSGSLTHNLYEVRLHGDNALQTMADYVQPFREWMQATVTARDLPALLNYRALAPFAAENHPTDEHLMPLFVALGAGDFENGATQIDYFTGELVYHTLAMDHVLLGA